MAENKKQSPSRFVLELVIVLLLVYCVSLSVFLVYLMRDYSLLKQHVENLQSRVDLLAESRVTASATVLPMGDHQQRGNHESNQQEAQQRTEVADVKNAFLGRLRRNSNGCTQFVCPSGPNGPQGPSGPPGEKGRRGKRGHAGQKGEKGPAGPTGLKGPEGPPGPQGSQGTKGEPGQRGEQGPPGLMVAESAHLLGDGKRVRHAGTVNRWKEGHVGGSIIFRRHQGALVIGRSGMYYVYSQMYYYDCSSYTMSHYTLLNGNMILGSESSVVDCNKAYNTNFHGGVFHLRRADELKIEVYKSKMYYMAPQYSYFGVFMLYPD